MFSKLVSCRRGVVSIEAAFVLPVLITLVIGGMEFALLLFTYSSMQTATREVARELAVNFRTQGQVADEVRARLPGWNAAAAQISVSQSAPADPALNAYTLLVTMPASAAAPITFLSTAAGDWTLRTEVTMKQELPL